MAWRIPLVKKLLIGAIAVCFIIAIYLGSSTIPTSATRRDKNEESWNNGFYHSDLHESQASRQAKQDGSRAIPLASKYHLAVIVPFRERFEELLIFAPYLHRFLTQKGISHDIVVVNQVDTYRFNRAALINIGFSYATGPQAAKPCDYIAMHDVDLLPLNNDLPYEYPSLGNVMHVAGPGLHPKYNYPTFIGGILLVTVPDFKKTNGMSNIYWGWGMEDDEFFVRLKQSEIKVIRPTGLKTGTEDTFRHIHSAKTRPRDTAKCFDQFNKTRRRDRITGLHNLNYTFLSLSNLTIDKAPVVILNVKLQCDTQISPWCNCSQSQSKFPPAVATKKQSKNNNKINTHFKTSKTKRDKIR